MKLLEKLNPMQKEAASYINGSLLILAGAGSGKTRVLTYRIAHMIEKGISPFNILAITFTNKASKEMRERVDSLIPSAGGVWVSTFHSMCVRILRREIEHLSYDSNFTIYDSDDSEKLIKKSIKELNLDDKQFPAKTIMRVISSWKDNLLTVDMAKIEFEKDFRYSKITNVYSLYQKKLFEANSLDFDDIIFKTVMLFEKSPEVLEKYQERFKYIMVDEYQDTNTSQYELIRLLSEKYKNLCVVGDDDQSIYGFRGANIRNILEFEKDFKNTKVIKLEQNYRSTQNILDSANSVINNNSARKEKSLWTDSEKGSLISCFNAFNDLEEAKFIGEKISESVKQGREFKDHAILYRNNALSRNIEEELARNKIPHKVFGGTRFYERKEIKDILAYLRFINNPKDNLSLRRIINVPKRGIGDSTIEKIEFFANENEISFFEAFDSLDKIASLGNRINRIMDFKNIMRELCVFSKNNSISYILKKVLDKTNYKAELLEDGTEESLSRVENIEEFISKSVQFEGISEDKSLTAFLEDIALVTDLDEYTEDENRVLLMTLHSSKGLEFPCVFMIGMEDGVFPGYRSLTSGDIKDIEEERRLCYVGITRAMEVLYMTFCKKRLQHGSIMNNHKSMFLEEINEKLRRDIMVEEKENKIEKKERTARIEKVERTGVSQFAEINKVKNSIDISFGGKNYEKTIFKEKDKILDFVIGDKVRQMKYGVGTVKEIRNAGADYEVSVEFSSVGIKKLMANLSKLKKI